MSSSVQLLRILIREELKHFLDNKAPSDVESEEDAWAGGENLVHSVDHLKSQGVKEARKLGSSELYDIIKDLANLQNEHVLPSEESSLELILYYI